MSNSKTVVLIVAMYLTFLCVMAFLTKHDSTKKPDISKGLNAVSCANKKPNINVTDKSDYS